MKLNLLLLNAFLGCSILGIAQSTKIDILETLLPQATKGERVNLLNQLSFQYFTISITTSDSFAIIALKEAREMNDTDGMANAYINMGYVKSNNGNQNEAIKLFKDAYDKSVSIKTKALAKNGLGSTLKSLALYDSALKEYQIAHHLFLEISDSSGIASALNNIGYANNRIGNFGLALEYYQKAFELNGLLKKHRKQVRNLINIAFIYIDQREEDRAKKYLKDALKLTEGTVWEKYKGDIYNGLALVEKAASNFNQASTYYELAIISFKKAGRRSSEAVVLHNLSDMHMEQGELERALDESLEALRIKKELNRTKSVVFSLSLLAEIHLRMHQPKEALSYANETLIIAKKHKLRARKRVAYNYIAEANEMLGNYKKALEAKKNYINLHDSLFNETKADQLARLEKTFQTERKEQEILIQNIKLASQFAQIQTQKRTNTFYLVGGSILLVLLTALFLQYKKQRSLTSQLKSQNTIISKQNLEKETLLKEIHHRVKNNLQVISSLLNLQSRHLDDQSAKEAVKESRSRIKSMSLIHQRLYSDNNLATIDMAEYLKELTEFLFATFKPGSKVIKKIKSENIKFDIDLAIPLGLIVNELISNSLKHAFSEDGGGNVDLDLTAVGNDRYQLVVSDNGKGLPNDRTNFNSMGMKLVEILVEQIHAEMIISSQKGTSFTISFTS